MKMAFWMLVPLLGALVLLGCSGGKEAGQNAASAPAVAETLATEARSVLFVVPPELPATTPGAMIEVPVTLRNTSPLTWPATALSGTDKALAASYHFVNSSGEIVVWDGTRTPITSDVSSGSELSLQLQVKAPDTPGIYQLQPDIVQEQVGWFGIQQTNPATVTLEVKAAN